MQSLRTIAQMALFIVSVTLLAFPGEKSAVLVTVLVISFLAVGAAMIFESHQRGLLNKSLRELYMTQVGPKSVQLAGTALEFAAIAAGAICITKVL